MWVQSSYQIPAITSHVILHSAGSSLSRSSARCITSVLSRAPVHTAVYVYFEITVTIQLFFFFFRVRAESHTFHVAKLDRRP